MLLPAEGVFQRFFQFFKAFFNLKEQSQTHHADPKCILADNLAHLHTELVLVRMSGLLVTGRLGVHGLAAIPIYMMAAEATRWLIDNIEPQLTGSPKEEDKKPESGNNDQNLVIISQPQQVAAQPGTVACKVVHAIPGRVRFHVPRLAEDYAYARRLERLLKTDEQVKSVRINYDAASVAITCHTSAVSVSDLINLIQLAENHTGSTGTMTTTNLSNSHFQEQQLENLIPQESPPLERGGKSEKMSNLNTGIGQLTLKADSLWASFKPPALSASLALMAKLPI